MAGGHRQLTATEQPSANGQGLLRTGVLRGATGGGAGRSHAATAGGAGGGVHGDGVAATAAAAGVAIASRVVKEESQTGMQLILLEFLVQKRGVLRMIQGVASCGRISKD